MNNNSDNVSYHYSIGPYLDHFSSAYGTVHLELTGFICIFGCVTNVLNVIIMTRPHMVTPSNVLLTGMSLAQFLLTVNYLCLIVHSSLSESCALEGSLHSYNWTVYKWINVNLSVVLHTTALLHTTCLSLFRYIAINKPYYSQNTLTVNFCKTCVFAMFLITPVLCTPTFFVTTVQQVEQLLPCNLQEAYNLNYSKSQNQFWKTTFWMFGLICKLLPSLTIALLTCNLIISLRKFDVLRERLKGRENIKRKLSQQRLSKMLLIVAALCLSVELPHGLLQVCTAILGPQFGHDVYDNVGDFFEMLTLLYNSVNFVLYCAMSSEFRVTFNRLVIKPLRKFAGIEKRSLNRKYQSTIKKSSQKRKSMDINNEKRDFVNFNNNNNVMKMCDLHTKTDTMKVF